MILTYLSDDLHSVGSLDTYIMAKPGGPSSLSPYYELGTDIVKVGDHTLLVY